ncbi:MAG: peptidase MA family metallohydrolase [bacterium]|nr:peptidase MA family metallohydrolase [bacterium]
MATDRFLLAAALALCLAVPAAADEAARLNNEGVEALGRGDTEEAVSLLEAARRLQPGSDIVAKNLAAAYLRKAERLIAAGAAGDAVHWLDEALHAGARDAVVANNVAAGYNDAAARFLGEGRYAEAASLLQTAVGLRPDDTTLRTNLGLALYRDNRRAEALDEFRAVAAADPDNALARKMSGLLYYWRGRMEDAMGELRAAAALAPGDAEVREALAKIEREYLVEKEFDVDTHVNFTVSFEGRKDYRVGREVIDALEEAWSRVGRDLNFYPRERIAVVIYSGRQFRDLLDKPKNVGGLYDGKIRVPAGGLDTERDRERLRRVLLHEYAHGVVHFLTHNRCPLWLNEGIAEYMSEQWSETKGRRLRDALGQGSLIPIAELSAVIADPSSKRIGLAYLQAHSIVRFIADRHGVYTLRRILDRIDAGDDIDAALRGALPVGLEGLEGEWRDSLK